MLRDDVRRNAMREGAYKLGREMVWSNVARLYMRSFELSRLQALSTRRKSLSTKTLDQRPREVPDVKLDHLSRMTDSTGIFQHAVFSVPNFSEGYCTDDNARAFILAVLLEDLGEEPERVRSLATTYAAFLCYAFDRKTGRFHNHLCLRPPLARPARVGGLSRQGALGARGGRRRFRLIAVSR